MRTDETGVFPGARAQAARFVHTPLELNSQRIKDSLEDRYSTSCSITKDDKIWPTLAHIFVHRSESPSQLRSFEQE